MQNFVRRQNIKLLEDALHKETDPRKREVLQRLLLEQQAMPSEEDRSHTSTSDSTH